MPKPGGKVFQDNYSKAAKGINQFKKPREMVLAKELDEEKRNKYKLWITFYRRNPHRFVKDYFGIHLHMYQILMLYVLQKSNLAYIVASRASAKTWILAVWSLTLAVLYPGIKIVVVSKTIKQGGIILSEKMRSLIKSFPNVAREVESLTTNSNSNECTFHNGSIITVVPAAESSRGNRSNYTIAEESRLIPEEIFKSVIKPFLFSRTPPYRLIPEYANDDRLKEEGLVSYITSAGYSHEFWFKTVKSCIRRMVSGDETANFLAFDFYISLYHNIKTQEMIKNEFEDNDEDTIMREYYNIPSTSSNKSYFRTSQFPRNIKRAWYPQKEDNYNERKNPYAIPKSDGEVRIISVDIATRAGKKNDQSIISAIKCVPMLGKGMERSLLYMESSKGEHTGLQAKRIKEVFHDFEADFLVLDLQNSGIKYLSSYQVIGR